MFLRKDFSTFELRELQCSDGQDIYRMLQTIGSEEFEFHNEVNGMSYEEYKNWLIRQHEWSQGLGLPEGYVKQWIFWLFVFDKPVGFGKLREKLTESSRNLGGNIGYAISSEERGKGYGEVLFELLLRKAREMQIETVMSTVEKTNLISKRIQEKCGGVLIRENDKRWYFNFASKIK